MPRTDKNASIEALRSALAAHKIDAETLERLASLPDPVATLRIKGGSPAIKTWRKLRELVPRTRHWPVLLGDKEELTYLEEQEPKRSKTSALFAAAAKTKPDPRAWLVESCGEDPDDEELDDEEADEAPPARWPRKAPPERYSVPFDILSRKPLKELLVALVPTRASWEVPIYLRFGNWNACPAPEQHASLMKRWSRQFGAEVVAITHAVVEMRVARPPRSREAALELARDQYAYCEDIVVQGCGSIEALAAGLWRAPSWYFWWD